MTDRMTRSKTFVREEGNFGGFSVKGPLLDPVVACASAVESKAGHRSSESTAVLDRTSHNYKHFSEEGLQLKESIDKVIAIVIVIGSKKSCLRFVHRSTVTCFVISQSLR
jgi:hypothetical protein